MTELVPPPPLTLVYGIATCEQPRWRECVASWNASALSFHPSIIVRHRLILDAYQEIYENSGPGSSFRADILALLHDDLLIHETDWDERILAEFSDPSVVLVGFGGAPGVGAPALYSQPFEVTALGRIGYQSNTRDAERHGSRFLGSRAVAILDGLALFVRREFLAEIGGWPLGTPVDYFCYDYWLSLMARRYGKKIRLVGVDCTHLGGGSTGLNPNIRVNHEEAHRWIYEEFRDVLPARVEDCNE